MTTNPIILLAPSPGMTFVAMPSGATYIADQNGIVTIANGSLSDQLALIAAGCSTLEPNVGGIVAPQTGTSYTVQTTDENNYLMFSNSAPIAVTLPNNLPMGFAVALYQGGAGQVTAQASTGGSIVTPNVATTPGQYCFLYCVVIANASGTNGQWDVICQPSQTGGGVVGASTLAALYSQDTTSHYAQYTIAQVFSDSTTANNGFWLKTGTGNGTGNWTQQSTITLASLNAAVANETARAEGAETALQTLANDIIFPDDPYWLGGQFDGNGGALIGLLPGGGVAGLLNSQQNPPQEDYVWPDDAGSLEGDSGFADMNSNLLFPVPDAHISSVAVTAASAALPNDDLAWPDDVVNSGGFLGDVGFSDANGNMLFPVASSLITSLATSAADSAVSSGIAGLPTDDAVWPDDAANIAGDVGLGDGTGNQLNYSPFLSPYALWSAGVSASNTLLMQDPASTYNRPLVTTRGLAAGLGMPDRFTGVIRWMDDASRGVGDPLQPSWESRMFNPAGASEVAAISGINKIVAALKTGQSLAIGTTAIPVLTTSAPFARGFMFNGGPMPYQAYTNGVYYYAAPGAICQDAQLQSLTPLYEFVKPPGLSGDCGETTGGGLLTYMALGSNLEPASVIAYATFGTGGATMTQLLQAGTANCPTSPQAGYAYLGLVRGIQNLGAWCALNGWALEIPCVLLDQGENDYTTSAASYTTYIQEMQGQVETALKAEQTAIGQTPPTHIPLLLWQPSSWAFYNYTTAPNVCEQLALAISNPQQFAMIGPQYWNPHYNTGSGQHMTAEGYKLLGQYEGRALKSLRAGQPTGAVYATAITNAGTTITITFSNTTQLVHDASLVTDPNGQWGIRLLANGSNVALSGFAIVGTNQIQCAAASSIAGMSCMLGIADYAYGTLGQTSGPTTSARASIRDSAVDVSSSDTGAFAMFNFACHQQFNFTGA